MDQKKTIQSYLVNSVSVLVLFVLLFTLMKVPMFGMAKPMINSHWTGVVMLIMINMILATSLNLTTGVLGQIALGHAGFMSVGAYAAAIFSMKVAESGVVLTSRSGPTLAGLGVFVGSLFIAGAVAALFGLIVGIPALRLKGDYLAIITLGFGEIIRVIIENIEITGGAQGLSGIPKLSNFNTVYWVTIATIAILFAFGRSRHGRAIIAIREDDIASEASGIPNTYYKVMAFTMSAFFAGVAGAVYAQQMQVLGAKTFNFMRSIDILVIVVLGGLGSLTGSIIAAIGLTILPEALRGFSEYRMLIYSVALIAVMIFKPSGLLGTYEFSLTKFLRRLKNPKKRERTVKGGSGNG